MSTAHRYLPKYTVEDYEQWKGDWELWQGIPVAMTPSPFGPHQRIAVRLATALQNSVDLAKCDAVVLAEIDWIVSDNTVVRPDVLLLCGETPVRHVEKAPAIIAEITSSSTEQLDREAKFSLYREQGVGYYLIVDPAKQAVEVYTLNEEGVYLRLPDVEEIVIDVCKNCRLSINRAKVFV